MTPLSDTPPGPAGSAPEPPLFVDERSDSSFRAIFVHFSGQAVELDTAISRIRLSGLDLPRGALGRIRRIRLLLAELDARTLSAESEHLLPDSARGPALRGYLEKIRRGSVEVRVAPLAGWSPDFTVFRDRSGPSAVLAGVHWFQRPPPFRGPAWSALHGPEAAARASRRFDELWRDAHDVSVPLVELLDRADRRVRTPASNAPPEEGYIAPGGQEESASGAPAALD